MIIFLIKSIGVKGTPRLLILSNSTNADSMLSTEILTIIAAQIFSNKSNKLYKLLIF